MGGPLYVQVRLGHTRPISELLDNLGWWLRSEGHGLYERTIQAENSVTLGWLLYSTRSIDLPSLKEAIEASDPELEVGLRWRLISLGTTGAIPVEQQVRAIHIEVDKSRIGVIKPRLYRLYGSTSSDPFPNGVKLRLVPEITPQMGPSSRAKVDRLRNRQSSFVQFSLSAQTWEIATLDYVDPELGTSLRQLLMSIPSSQIPNRFVFHSVDPHWQRNGHIITFLPDLEVEARTIIAGMIPFLVFHYQDYAERIYSMFTADAVRRVTEETMAKWDPVSNSVVTFEDGILDSLESIDAEYLLSGPVQVEGGPVAPSVGATLRPEPSNLRRPVLFTDTDSVSTFRTQGTTRSRGRTNARAGSAGPPSASPSASTHQTSVSSVTLEDRMAAIESHVDRFIGTFEAFMLRQGVHSSSSLEATAPSQAAASNSQGRSDGLPTATAGVAGGASNGGAVGRRH